MNIEEERPRKKESDFLFQMQSGSNYWNKQSSNTTSIFNLPLGQNLFQKPQSNRQALINANFEKEKLTLESQKQSRGLRDTTIKKSLDSLLHHIEAAFEPSGHMDAKSRAIGDSVISDTASDNRKRIQQLHSGKEYKQGTFRIHFKGEREKDGMTTGSLLDGADIKRSSWTTSQKLVNHHFSENLLEGTFTKDFIGAPHRGGEHGAEIAHLRAQHAGGMTDEIGAQSASWHSNVEDMAREEGQRELVKKFGQNVRIKSTAYIHEDGEWAGTVKASRHKIYLRGQDGIWHKKFDHLQDGARGNINVSEVTELREKVSKLSLLESDKNLHLFSKPKGINPFSDISHQAYFMPKENDSTTSPYFTDIKRKNFRGVMETISDKSKALDFTKSVINSAAENLRQKITKQ